MSYRPPRKSLLGAHVSQRVAVVLAAWLPDDQVFKRTASMPEDLRNEVLATIDAIKAAAVMHKQAYADLGNRPAAITPEPEESLVEGTSPAHDPAGAVLLCVDSAAWHLGVKPRRVRQLCVSGALKAEKVGVAWMITRESIDDYLATKDAA